MKFVPRRTLKPHAHATSCLIEGLGRTSAPVAYCQSIQATAKGQPAAATVTKRLELPAQTALSAESYSVAADGRGSTSRWND